MITLRNTCKHGALFADLGLGPESRGIQEPVSHKQSGGARVALPMLVEPGLSNCFSPSWWWLFHLHLLVLGWKGGWGGGTLTCNLWPQIEPSRWNGVGGSRASFHVLSGCSWPRVIYGGGAASVYSVKAAGLRSALSEPSAAEHTACSKDRTGVYGFSNAAGRE